MSIARYSCITLRNHKRWVKTEELGNCGTAELRNCGIAETMVGGMREWKCGSTVEEGAKIKQETLRADNMQTIIRRGILAETNPFQPILEVVSGLP